MGEAPVAERDHDREHLDAGLGERVRGPLPTAGAVAGEQPGGHKLLEAAGEDVGGDALLGAGDQLAEVAAVAEHDVAQHEHRPRVAEDLDGGVDRASRAWGVVHAVLRKVLAICHCFRYGSRKQLHIAITLPLGRQPCPRSVSTTSRSPWTGSGPVMASHSTPRSVTPGNACTSGCSPPDSGAR